MKPEFAAPQFELDFSEERYPTDINAGVRPGLRISAEQEAAFAAHVEYVDEKGDAGNIPSLRTPEGWNLLLRSRASLTMPTIGALEISTVMADISKPGFLALSGILAATGLTYHRLRYKHHDLPHAQKALGKPAQEELGERYELYKKPGKGKKPPQTYLRYYGPLDQEETSVDNVTPLDRVQRMALLANKYGVDGVVLSDSMLKTVVGDEKVKEVLGTAPYRAERVVDLQIGRKIGAEKIAVHPPEYWLKYKNEAREADVADNIVAAVKVLGEINPEDKTVQVFQYYEGDQQRARFVAQAAQQFALAELSYTDQTVFDPEELPEGRSRQDMRKDWEARFSGNDIIWEAKGIMQRMSLDEYLRLDAEGMSGIMNNPRIDPAKARILAQAVAASAVIEDFGVKKDEEISASTVFKDENRPLFDRLLTKETADRWAEADSIYQPGQKFAVGSLSGALMLLGFAVGTIPTSLYTSTARSEARWGEYDITKLFNEQHLSFTDQDVKNRLSAENPVAGAWQAYEDTVRALDFGRTIAVPNVQPSSRPSETIDKNRYERLNDSARGEWDISTIGHSGTSGYWSLSTSSKLNIESFDWEAINKLDASKTPALLPTSYERTDSGLMASRYINYKDLIPGTDLIRIPVRNGTMPAAANLDGRPVKLNYIDGGTYALQVPGKLDNTRLTFWLQEDRVKADLPHAVTNAEASFMGKTVDPEGVDQVWAGVIPGYLDMDAEHRRGEVRLYVEDNFKYRLRNVYRPVSDNNPLVSISKSMLDTKTAQCYYSNTLEGIATMTSHEKFAIAGGFLVAESKAPQLSSHRYHAWGVSADVNEDGTPSNDILPEDSAWLNQKPTPNKPSDAKQAQNDGSSGQDGQVVVIDGQSYVINDQTGAASSAARNTDSPFIELKKPVPPVPESEQTPLWPYGAVPAGVALGGVALLKRRRLAEQRLRMMAAYDKRWLERNPDATSNAAEVIDAMRWDPQRDILSALERVQKQTEGQDLASIDVTPAVEKLLKPENHGPHMKAHIDDALWETPHAEYTRTIKGVRQALRRARRIHEHPRPEKKKPEQKNDKTGQLEL